MDLELFQGKQVAMFRRLCKVCKHIEHTILENSQACISFDQQPFLSKNSLSPVKQLPQHPNQLPTSGTTPPGPSRWERLSPHNQTVPHGRHGNCPCTGPGPGMDLMGLVCFGVGFVKDSKVLFQENKERQDKVHSFYHNSIAVSSVLLNKNRGESTTRQNYKTSNKTLALPLETIRCHPNYLKSIANTSTEKNHFLAGKRSALPPHPARPTSCCLVN